MQGNDRRSIVSRCFGPDSRTNFQAAAARLLRNSCVHTMHGITILPAADNIKKGDGPPEELEGGKHIVFFRDASLYRPCLPAGLRRILAARVLGAVHHRGRNTSTVCVFFFLRQKKCRGMNLWIMNTGI